MVHKRYVKRGGKTYGPYFYDSYRDEKGKVRNKYLGEEDPNKKNFKIPVVLLLLTFGLFLLLSNLDLFKINAATTINFKDQLGTNLQGYELEETSEGYNLIFQEGKNKVIIEGITNLPKEINAYLSNLDLQSLAAKVFAINEENGLEFKKAIITLEKQSESNGILYCPKFNFKTGTCPSWEKVNIPYVDNGDTITFEVTHFSAYSLSGSTQFYIYDSAEVGNYYSNRSAYASSIQFVSNYTDNATGDSIAGNCTIAFNTTGTFTEHQMMNYNASGFEGSYTFNYSFDRSGSFQYNMSCNASGYATLSQIDYFNVSNLAPYAPNYPGALPAQSCTEDTACTYNFALNVTDYDYNDLPLVNFTLSNAFSCISINATTGIVTVNCTEDSETGIHSLTSLEVLDASAYKVSKLQEWTVAVVNDPPGFNTTDFNITDAYEDIFFSYDIDAYDEENGSYPNLRFSINATYPWLNINDTTGNISFLPTNDITGVYNVNLTVNDSTGLTTSTNLQINILDVNDAPNITFACSPNLTDLATEELFFGCIINASDIDFSERLNFTANYSWLNLPNEFIDTSNNNLVVQMNVTADDLQVGLWYVNITVNDDGGLQDSEIIMLNITNFEERPTFTNILNITADAGVPFLIQFNATDNDTVTPQAGDTITFSDNSSLFVINPSTGVIDFTPLNTSAGTHWINITITDNSSLTSSRVINFTIVPNTAPNYTGSTNIAITEGIKFYINLTLNVSDPEGDLFTFIDNTSLFDITSSGNITLNATELDIGTHWVLINITDSKGVTSGNTINFTVYNVNQPPNFTAFIGYNASEGQVARFNISANDSDLLNSNNAENLTFTFNYSWIEFTKPNATTVGVSFIPGADSSGYFWVNVTVNDTSGEEASMVFYLNITDSADDPDFTTVCTEGRSINEDEAFSCTINATDTDAGTTLTFTANYTWFSMNNTAQPTDVSNTATTTVSFTPDYTEVGNYTINITVSDGAYNTTTTIPFNISSVNDAPNITTRDVITGYIFQTITYDINVTDEEHGVDGLGNNLTFRVNDTTFSIDNAGSLSFSPGANDNATYWVNVSVNDSLGAETSYVYNFTVYSNVAPSCSVFLRGGVPSSPPENFNLTENESTGQFISTCSDIDGNTIYYSWFWNGVLNSTGTTNNAWNYTASLSDRGEKNITLVVTDLLLNNTYYWNVSVAELPVGPAMYGDIPNISSGWFQDSSETVDMDTYFYDSNNDNLVYDWWYYGINDSFSTINLLWINQSTTWNITYNLTNFVYSQSAPTGTALSLLNQTVGNITSLEVKIRPSPSGNAKSGICFRAQTSDCSSSYKVYFDAANQNFNWEVQDNGTAFSNSSVNLTVQNNTFYWIKVVMKTSDLAIYYSNNSFNYTLGYNVTNVNNFSSGKVLLFTENTAADFDEVVLKHDSLGNISSTFDDDTNIYTLTPDEGWFGKQSMYITAKDPTSSITSNEFFLTVYYATPGTVSVPQVQTVSGGSSSVTEVASMDILIPSFITLNPLSSTIVPIIINNSGKVKLNRLTLEAFSNETGLKLDLDTIDWKELDVGKSVQANLEVTAGELTPERYVIELKAKSGSPSVTETAKINIDVRERQAALKTQLQEQIQFTRDLFLQNPECLELMELLDKAQGMYDEGNYEEGLSLVEKTSEGCKNFIAQKEKLKLAKAQNFLKDNWKVLLAEVSALAVIASLVMYTFKRRKFKKISKS